MQFFGLVWATSWVSFFLTSSQGFLKIPDYFVSTFPSKVLSIVNNPIELPTPIFSTPLTSAVSPSHSSLVTLPNLTFATSAGISLPQPIQAFPRPWMPVNAGENAFCYPESEQKKDSFPVASMPQTTSGLSKETSSHHDSKSTFSQQIWQVVQNLLPWRQRNEPLEESLVSSVVVVSTNSDGTVEDKQNDQVKRVKNGFWQYSQRLKKQAVVSTSKEKERFQVWVKNYLIGQFPKQSQAELIAQRLKQFLSDSSSPALKAAPVESVFSEGVPTLKIGDRLLFKIDEAFAKTLNRNPELLAIEWANNLRLALGKKPFPLAEAQRRMYNLVATSKTFQGRASWYGTIFHGRLTATGETYDKHELTAAHPTLPFDTYLKVKNRKNDHSVIVRINDRGPYVPDRSLDLSQEAARCLNSEKVGVVPFEAVIMQSSSKKINRYISRK